MDMNLSKLRKTVEDREAWRVAVHGVAKSWTWLSIWRTTIAFRYTDQSKKTKHFINLEIFSGTFLAVQLVKTTLLLQGAWVQSLAGELRSYMPCGTAKNWVERGKCQFKSKNRHLVCGLLACDHEQCLLLWPPPPRLHFHSNYHRHKWTVTQLYPPHTHWGSWRKGLGCSS